MIPSQVRFKKIQQSYYLIFSILGAAAIMVGVVFVLGKVTYALWTIGITLFIVFLLHSFVDALQRHHIKRVFGIILGYLMIIGILVLIGVIIGPIVNKQVASFASALPAYAQQLSDWANGLWTKYGYMLDEATIATWIESFSGQINNWTSELATNAASSLITAGARIVTGLVITLMSLVAAFWLLLDYHRIANEIHIIVGPRHQEGVSTVVGICGRCFGGYLKGIIAASICTGTIAGIGFHFLGLPYATFLGFLTAVMNIIPVIGPWIAGIVAAIIGITISPLTAILSILITVIAQEFTDTFITPRIMSTTVELHAALVIFALAVGAAVGGALGMILAVPVTATIKAVFVYYFEKKTNRRLVSDKGAFFRGTGDSGSAADPVSDAGYAERRAVKHHEGMSGFFVKTDRPAWRTDLMYNSHRNYDDVGSATSDGGASASASGPDPGGGATSESGGNGVAELGVTSGSAPGGKDVGESSTAGKNDIDRN